MNISANCNKAKTIVLDFTINDWKNYYNADASSRTYAIRPEGGVALHFMASFGNIAVAIHFVREVNAEVITLDPYVVRYRVTVDAHVVTSIDGTEKETITEVTSYLCDFGDPEYYTYDYSMTGAFTIELDQMHLWETYLRQNEDYGGDAISWGYPVFPYWDVSYSSYTTTWSKNNRWKGGEMSGHEMSRADYFWRYGGGDTGASNTTVTIAGSITVDGTEVTISDTGTIGTGDPHYLGLNCDIWNNYNGAESTAVENGYTAVLKGTGVDLPYSFEGVDFDFDAPEGYYGIGYTVLGDDAGTLSVINEGFDPEGVMQVTPVLHVTSTAYPILNVAANGRVLPIGGTAWADDTEYPPVKIRPLWRSSDVPPSMWGYYFETPPIIPFFDPVLGASIELAAGVYSAALSLQKVDLIIGFYSRDDIYRSTWHEQYFRNEHTLGVVLEQSNTSDDYTEEGTDHWLADAHQYSGAWRVISQDAWVTKPAKVRHAESGSPPYSYICPANYDIVNSADTDLNYPEMGDLTILASGAGATLTTQLLTTADDHWDLSEYRYLEFAALADANCNLTLTLTFEVGTYDKYGSPQWTWADHTKSWVIPVTTVSGLCVADLVAPDTISEGSRPEYDTTDWAFDKTTAPSDEVDTRSPGQVTPSDDGTLDDMDFVPNHLFGVGRVKEAVISIPAGRRVSFLGSQTPLQMVVKYRAASNETDRVTLTVAPVFQLSDTVGEEHRWTRLVNGTWELDPDWWKFHPEGKRVVSALVNYKQCLDLPYARVSETGYRCTAFLRLADLIALWDKNAGQDWVLSDIYAADDDNPDRINVEYPALALSPVKWDGSTAHPVRDVDVFSAAYELEARLPCDHITVCPGAGDPQGSATAYPYYFYAELGSRLQGITHKETTFKAFPSGEVQVYRGASKLGDYASNYWAYWRSGVLRVAASEAAHTVKYQGMSPPVRMSAWTGRYQWISLLGYTADLGGGVSYDVTPCSRHFRATTLGGTIRVGSAGNVLATKLNFTDLDTGLTGECPVLRVERGAKITRVWLLYIVSGEVKVSYSVDEGRSWGGTMALGSGTKGCLVLCRDGRRIVYWRTSGGAIKSQVYDGRDKLILDDITVVASGVDDLAFDADESVGGVGSWRVIVHYFLSGTLTQVVSTDMKTYA